ncbi:peptidase inhibitor family I36 protein [Actinomadura spongiicola]|nr:peptidase inhibitor family I36 protein [Actinomadura spongiicola]
MKNIKSRIAILATATAMFCASGAIVTSPVLAATGWNRCPVGYYCVFDGHDGTGTMAYFKWGSPNLADQNMDNKVSSYWNRTTRYFGVYDGYNYTGWGLWGQKGEYRSNIPAHYYAHNRASSLRAVQV